MGDHGEGFRESVLPCEVGSGSRLPSSTSETLESYTGGQERHGASESIACDDKGLLK